MSFEKMKANFSINDLMMPTESPASAPARSVAKRSRRRASKLPETGQSQSTSSGKLFGALRRGTSPGPEGGIFSPGTIPAGVLTAGGAANRIVLYSSYEHSIRNRS